MKAVGLYKHLPIEEPQSLVDLEHSTAQASYRTLSTDRHKSYLSKSSRYQS